MKVAIVGFGEVGRAYAGSAAAAGYEVVVIDPYPAVAAVALADRLGFTVNQSPEGCVGGVDQAWICVAGDLVKKVCLSLIGELPESAVVVDMTTASAEDKRTCAAIVCAHATPNGFFSTRAITISSRRWAAAWRRRSRCRSCPVDSGNLRRSGGRSPTRRRRRDRDRGIAPLCRAEESWRPRRPDSAA